ncbi:MAG: anchored repeat ABC transporter, substrate-binding protein [Corynebacterium sp.]|nr:anchored repeat ABC transporter, substrate-binding protein [Corynebacterium sp.]
MAATAGFLLRGSSARPTEPLIVATTPIIADIVDGVAGGLVPVRTLIPPNADTHSYEPTLASIRDIANAQVIFENGLLLEDQSINRAIDNHRSPGTQVVALAEQLGTQGNEGYQLPVVENRGQDTIWLGLRVIAQDSPVDNATQVRLRMVDAQGPGTAHAFIIGTFGQPQEILAVGTKAEALLPANAHTHVSWAFSAPGDYALSLVADLVDYDTGEVREPIATGTVHFRVGQPADLGAGHQDLTINVDSKNVEIRGDGPEGHNHVYDLGTVMSVPPLALTEVPADPAYRFLGRAGEPVYLLQQAVVGKHIHGEMDPHVWLDPANALAMVDMVERTLTRTYPQFAGALRANAQTYRSELAAAADEVRAAVATVPEGQRYLATTHDAYSYFAHAFGLDIAGFISPSAGVEPSPAQLLAFQRSLQNLHIPAVFLEPTRTSATKDIETVAANLGLATCTIYGDTFAPTPGLPALLRANAAAIGNCLGAGNS